MNTDADPFAIFIEGLLPFIVSAVWEQEKTIVFSFHAHFLRGANCKHLLLNTVLFFHSVQVGLQKRFLICQMSSVYQAASKNRC